MLTGRVAHTPHDSPQRQPPQHSELVRGASDVASMYVDRLQNKTLVARYVVDESQSSLVSTRVDSPPPPMRR
jgi:hypothetical protein